MIRETMEYYQNKSSDLFMDNTTSDYIVKAWALYEQESQLVDDFLKHATKDQLLNVYLEKMITEPGLQILEKENGMFDMLENGKVEELKLMYRLFKIR